MKKILLIGFIIALSINAFAQQIHSDSEVEVENQKNQDIVKINKLWKDYLMSNPDSLYDNPYWNKADKEKYKSYDLLRSEGYLELYGLANYGVLKNLVLSIKPLDDKYYDIHSMYYWGNFMEYPYVLCTTHVLSFKDDDGKFVLGNWLEYYSRNWKKVTKGKITFHYQVYKRDNAKIRKAIKFLSFLKREYNVEVNHLDIYISKGWNESQRLKGFGYDIGESAVSDARNIGGTTDTDNNIIYSNSAKGEFYQHEMMRLVISHYHGANSLLFNGLSEYYSETSEMRGISFKEHFKNLDVFLSAHPEIDLKVFDKFDSGNLTERNYLIGMVLVKMIEDRCGHNKLLEALNTIHTYNDLIVFLNKEFGIKENEINTVLRTYIKQYASDGFKTKRWESLK